MRTAGNRSIALGVLIACLVGAVLVGCAPQVPNVTGMAAGEAVRTLQSAGYTLGATTRTFTSSVPAGQVFAQNPAAGASLKKGEPVNLNVVASLGSLSVPDVSKLSAEEASKALAAAQLVPLQVDQYSSTVAKGSIGGQVPDAGAKVDPGATVVYVVSKGAAPDKTKVPDVTGKSRSDADAAIAKAGLNPAAQRAYSDSVARDVIVLQSPAAGASVSPDSVVSYVVSMGKSSKSVTVPAVTGKKQSDASSALQSAGLGVQTYRQSDPKVARDVVIGQMPPAGSKTAAGGVVGLLISSGPESVVAVPDVTGRNEADARAAIEAAGLVAYPVDQPSADVAAGTIAQQLPLSGSVVALGSPVLYAVSTGTPK